MEQRGYRPETETVHRSTTGSTLLEARELGRLYMHERREKLEMWSSVATRKGQWARVPRIVGHRIPRKEPMKLQTEASEREACVHDIRLAA